MGRVDTTFPFCPFCKLDIAPTISELDISGEEGLKSLGSEEALVNPVLDPTVNWFCCTLGKPSCEWVITCPTFL